MNLNELASLVTVRNHLNTIVSSTRADRKLLNVVAALDKVFLEECGKLNTSQLAERSLTVVKVGNSDYMPTPKDLEEFKKVFEQAKADKDFSLITHQAVDVRQYKLAPDEAIHIGSQGEIRVMPPREIVAQSGQLSMNFAEKPTEEESKAIEGALKKLSKNVQVTEEGAQAVAKEVTKEKKPVDDKQLLAEITKDHAAEDKRLQELAKADQNVDEAVEALREQLNTPEAIKAREEQEQRDNDEIAARLAQAKKEIPPDAAQPKKKAAFRRVKDE
jgi:hypothetical protein